MRRPLAAALLAATLLTTQPSVGFGEADKPLDYDIPGGHFYTQTNGVPTGASARGYSITDDFGVPFWSEFRRLGGVGRLGYPVTRRFVWNGLIGQATQKAVLQWVPETGTVQVADIMDYLAKDGKEDVLQQQWLVPACSSDGCPGAADTAAVMRWFDEQGDANLPFKRFYGTAPDPLQLYGIPTSKPRDLGPLVAVRFQKGVLQLWKQGGERDLVTAMNGGDLIKILGVLPREALEPMTPPTAELLAEVRRRQVSSRGAAGPGVRGVATWYGEDFHGQEMRNGEIYDMYDPTTTAANIFPLESWVRVTNVDNGVSVDVRVTDTGAFRYPIVVDLSWAAFRKLDNPNKGVIDVVVQPIERN